MPLTVLSIAYPFAPVLQAAVGGAEKILSDLDRALLQEGHRSLVVACEGSDIAGTLLRLPRPGDLHDEARRQHRGEVQTVINRALARYAPDVVHMHGIDFHDYSLPAAVPTVVTLHLPISWYPQEVWERWQHVRFIAVSESQRLTAPPQLQNCTVIPNGVDVPLPQLDAPREEFALVMGRICPEKNQHAALDAGTLAGMPVLLAGQVFPYEAHQRYFQQEIEPRLQAGHGHRMLGPVDEETRQRLLARARCLLHPTLAPETSSLVAMESLAAGTPVVAYPSGALADIVDHGITGLLVETPEAMARAMTRVGSLSREACRHAAETRFNREDMLRRYLQLYATMVNTTMTEAGAKHG